MANEPLNGMTLRDLLLDCAERWGYADQRGSVPAIPTDAARLALCLRKINAGYREFLLANPNWTFLYREHSVLAYPDGDGPDNIDGDAGRYRLPGFISSAPLSDWKFVGDSRPRTYVRRRHVEIVRKRRAIQTRRTGIPDIAGVGTIQVEDGADQRASGYEVVFWPAPALAYEMEATFRVDGHTLVDLNERHIAGQVHDRTIIAFCNWEHYRDDSDDESLKARYKAELFGDRGTGDIGALGRSIQIDNLMRERHHGTTSTNRNAQMNRRKTHRYLGRVSVDGSYLSETQ